MSSSASDETSTAKPLVAILMFLVCFCLAWTELLWRNRVPVNGEVLRWVYPNWQIYQWIPGKLGLAFWDPFHNMGQPFLADPAKMVLYPLRWLFLLVHDFHSFLVWWILIHTALAGGFTYALLRRQNLGNLAGLFGAEVAAFNGFFMAHAPYPNHFAAAAFLPALLYFQWTKRPGALGIAIALQWFAGYPPFFFLSLMALVAAGLFQGRKSSRITAQAIVLGVGLCAAQWIPFLQMLHESGRPLFLAAVQAAQNSIPRIQLCKMLFLPQWIWMRPETAGDMAVQCFYAGCVPLMFSLAGFFIWRADRALIAATLSCLLLSLGAFLPGFQFLRPLHFFRFPGSWLLLAAAGLTVSAARTLNRLPRPWQAAVLALSTIDLLAFSYAPKVAWFDKPYLTRVPSVARLIASSPVPGRLLCTSSVIDAWDKTKINAVEDFLIFKNSLVPSIGVAFGVQEVVSHETILLKRATDFQDRLMRRGPNPEFLRWAGVQEIITLDHPARTIEPENLRTVEFASLQFPLLPASKEDGPEIQMDRWAPGQTEARVKAKKPVVMVFSQVAFPGWHATLDGKEASCEVFEKTFLSVRVPTGEHRVGFHYHPVIVLWGVALSILTVLAGCL